MSERLSEGMDSSLGRSDPAVPAISRAVSDSERLSPQPEGLRPQGREKVLPEPSEHTGSPLPVNPCTFIVVPAALPRSEHRLCSAGWSPALPSPVCSLCAGPGPMRQRGPVPTCFPSLLRAYQSESLSLWDPSVTQHRTWHMGATGSV